MPANPALSITKAASKQTFYTIRLLVDRERVQDAYLAYAYFRWVDDTIDADSITDSEQMRFLERQKHLLESCCNGKHLGDVDPHESMLVELLSRETGIDTGLHAYLHGMMRVMEFDARRRGRLISQSELDAYTFWLSSAVTEALHYFIGHCCTSPHNETRYLAVTAAHITHMLRDTYDDVQAGYYNIPREVLEANQIGPRDVHSPAYRAWVKSRVQKAQRYFEAGRAYLGQVESLRCRLAGLSYTARFEWLLDTIESEGYNLRPLYEERKSAGTALRMSWQVLTSIARLSKNTQLRTIH